MATTPDLEPFEDRVKRIEHDQHVSLETAVRVANAEVRFEEKKREFKTKRDRERHQQHDPHGLKKSDKTSVLQLDMELWTCPCGWSGWLSKEEETDGSEAG